MASTVDSVVLVDEDASEGSENVCFVCGNQTVISDGVTKKIVDATTSFLHVPLANKLGDLVGNDFCIVVSKFDKVCHKCFSLIDEVDSLEEKIDLLKKKVLDLLEKTYSMKDNFEKSVVKLEPVWDDADMEVIDEDSSEIVESFISLNHSIDCSNDHEEPFEKKEFCSGIFCEYCSLFCQTEELYHEHLDKNHKGDDEMIPTVDEDSNSKDSLDRNQECMFELIASHDESALEIKEQSNKSLQCDKCSQVFVSELVLKCHECPFSNDEIQEETEVPVVVNLVQKDPLNNTSKHFRTTTNGTVSCKTSDDASSSRKKTQNCEICGVPFVSSSALARHTQVHNKSEGPVVCHVCGKECHDNLHALYHRRNEHNIANELTCGICNLMVESTFELKNHILLAHRGKKEFKCVDCGETFSRSVQYENHRLYSHGNNQCRVCDKFIDDPIKLRQHEHRHARTDMKKFECEVCQRTFKTPGGLRVHKVSHTGKYKFFCEFCGRGFMSRVILEEHKGVHTKEERYVCDICGRKFILYSTFHLHQQWHKNPYPFPCRMCGRKFRYRSERSNHVRRDHTGELPHKCPYCEAAFIKSSYLKKHITGHTKTFPFNCALCVRGFDQKRALARHMSKFHEDNSLLESMPKKCQYKVALRPEEYPEMPQ